MLNWTIRINNYKYEFPCAQKIHRWWWVRMGGRGGDTFGIHVIFFNYVGDEWNLFNEENYFTIASYISKDIPK